MWPIQFGCVWFGWALRVEIGIVGIKRRDVTQILDQYFITQVLYWLPVLFVCFYFIYRYIYIYIVWLSFHLGRWLPIEPR